MGFYDNPGWGRNYIELVKPFQSNWHSESTFSKPYFDSTCLWFDMNQTLHDKFDNSNTVEDQERILQQFMDEVLLFPMKWNH